MNNDMADKTSTDTIVLDSIESALADFAEGKMVIVVDDEDRENEGDLIVAAEKITPEQVNFMLKNARGVLCAPLSLERCRQLNLMPMVEDNTSMLGTPFTVSVDLLEGCTTGVSSHDRCATIRALADPEAKPEWFGARATSTRSTPRTRECSAARATQKPPSIWPVSRVCAPPRHSWK